MADKNQFESVREAFLKAVNLDHSSQQNFLNTLDQSIGDEVKELLKHHNSDNALFETAGLEKVIAESVDSLNNPPSHRQLPFTLGNYHVLEIIGEGGMGVVYRAEQQEPVIREVAIKFIGQRSLSANARLKFDLEKQLMARMEHPGIAKVFDAGTDTSGQPYVVMELIRGEKITTYCDNNKLIINDRLKLFLKLCDSIEHAHQKAVIHRDLKPANILVEIKEGGPLIKIIDFGIAKPIGSEDIKNTMTREGFFAGTPSYMAPEQILRGESDIRSDIYALGIVLFELLCSHLPLDLINDSGRNIEQLRQDLLNRTPEKPSELIAGTLNSSLKNTFTNRSTTQNELLSKLRHDLDWIAGKAIDRDPDSRYGTVTAFADDIRNYLDNLPLKAGPPTINYRFRKYVKRHKLLVITGIAIFMALLLGIITTSWQTFRALKAEQLAQERNEMIEREAKINAAMNDFLIEDLLSAADPSVDGRNVRVIDLLDNASHALPYRFEHQPHLQSAMRLSLGRTYLGLGQFAQAVSEFESALLAASADSIKTFEIQYYLSVALHKAGKDEKALELISQVHEISIKTHSANHTMALKAQILKSEIFTIKGNWQQAENLVRKVYDSLSAMGVSDDLYFSSGIALVAAIESQERKEEAETILRDLVNEATANVGRLHPTTILLRENLAHNLLSQGEQEIEAEEIMAAALIDAQDILGPAHETTLSLMHNLGLVNIQLNHKEHAVDILEQACSTSVKHLGWQHYTTIYLHSALGRALNSMGEYNKALKVLLTAEPHVAEAFPIENPMSGFFDGTIALALMGDKHCDNALIYVNRSIEKLELIYGRLTWHPQVQIRNKANILSCLNMKDKAKQLLTSNIAELEMSEGTINSMLRSSVILQAELLSKWGEKKNAITILNNYEKRIMLAEETNEPKEEYLDIVREKIQKVNSSKK